MKAKQAFKEIQSGGKRWALFTDPDSMLFYRTQSYKFQFVEATLAGKDTGFVLRLYGGASTRPPVALYFKLVKIQPVMHSGVLSGHFIKKDDTLVRLNLQLSFKNAGGMALNDTSTGIAPNGYKYAVH